MQSLDDSRPNLEPTGVPGFDQLVRGGLAARRLFLVQGPPGTGKTTFGLQFLLEGLRRDQRCLYVTLSESEDEIRAVADSHGWALGGIHIHDLSKVQDTFLEQENSLFNPGDIELKETTQPVLDLISELKPQRVVFDSLSELRMLAANPLRYRRRVLGLKQHLARHGCTTLLLDDGTSDDAGDLQLQSLAHGVISVEMNTPVYGRERRRIQVRKMRAVGAVGGFHELALERGGARVFPRMEAAAGAAAKNTLLDDTGVSSGIQAIDALLGGGPARGTSTLIAGPAGTGKSVLVSLYAHAAIERGEKAAVFLFEETKASFFTRCHGLGIDLVQASESGQLMLRTVDPAEMSPSQFGDLLMKAVEDGATVVGIDSLNGYGAAMPEERALSLHLHELLSVLAARNVSTFMVLVHHGMFESASPFDVSYIADNVMLLRYFEAHGTVRKALSVVKKRSGSHESTIRELRLGRKIEVGPPLAEFEAVFSGSPRFVGASGDLLKATSGLSP